MPNESQTERRPHIVSLHLYEMYRNAKSIKEKKSRLVAALSWGWEQKILANRHEASFEDDRYVLILDCSDSCPAL